ncbi:hypothetical protein HZS_3732, partial [Henneguya salminicola]
MLRRALSVISQAYQTFVEPVTTPWGFNDPIDQFQAYLLVKDFFVSGVISLYNSKNISPLDQIKFEFFHFEDRMSPEYRHIVRQTYKFHLPLNYFREISFHFSVNASSSSHLDEPIDLNNQNLSCSCVIDARDEAVTSENLLFCKLVVRYPIAQDNPSMEMNCLFRKADEISVNYTFCFGISKSKAAFLLCHLRQLCPLMQIRTSASGKTYSSVSDICKKSTLSNINNELINTVSINSKILSTQMFTEVFGALMSETPYPSFKYYGTGESFVYSFKDDSLKVVGILIKL